MDFSIMFWGDTANIKSPQKAYQTLLEITKYADSNGFSAVWLPERHFHTWGGMHPNPAVLGAALATVTSRLKLRAGSVVLPLHHPVSVAEEWSVVDNLSGGRVELAIASGWKDDDFVLAPERYAKRRQIVWDSLKVLRDVWRGDPYAGVNGSGTPVQVRLHPRPVQPELPVWITSAGALRTMVDAGGAGLNLLTHLLGQDYTELGKSVAQYKAYRVRGGFTSPGKVALMLHTFLGKDRAQVKETVREAMSSYLHNSADLAIPAELRQQWASAPPALIKDMIDVAFQRYFETASLMGTPQSCRPTVQRLVDMGVSEICCLVDFGLDLNVVLDNLSYLAELKATFR